MGCDSGSSYWPMIDDRCTGLRLAWLKDEGCGLPFDIPAPAARPSLSS
jgi:hypothetical protein